MISTNLARQLGSAPSSAKAAGGTSRRFTGIIYSALLTSCWDVAKVDWQLW